MRKKLRNKNLIHFNLIIFFVLLFVKISFSQIPGHTNLPPTGKISNGKYKYIDYEFKLNNNNEPVKKLWLSKFSSKELNQLKYSNKKLYDYYYNANNYFESLSDRVKSTYTLEEFWYIYMFDQNLKKKLSTIN